MSAKSKPCPACGAKGCAAISLANRGQVSVLALGPCGACGWCRHTTDICDYTAATGLCERCDRPAKGGKKWDAAEDLPRPAKMSDEEFGFRATLFLAWLTEPASSLRRSFEVFADWLADRGSAEEVAARADWTPYASKKQDPKAWWQWTVRAGAGWAFIEPGISPFTGGSDRAWDAINFDRAKITRPMHNGAWFLCWPPGFVRITAPLHHDVTRWRMTIERERGLAGSRPIERVWPGGYTQLLLPFVAGEKLAAEGGVIRTPSLESEDLGLFADQPTEGQK